MNPAYDAESIAYYSVDDKMYIVTKDGGMAKLCKVNQDQYSLNKAEYVCSFEDQIWTCGHLVIIHWGESVMLLRTYNPSRHIRR